MLSFAPVGVLALIVYSIIMFFMRRRISLRRLVLSFVLFIYVLGVIAVTLFPIPVDSAHVFHLNPGDPLPYNIVPFRTIVNMITMNPYRLNALVNIVGNMALFVPFGFLFPVVYNKLSRVSRIISIGFAASLLIESCQLLVSYALNIFFRSFDVDDLMLNTLGVIVGYLLLWLVQAIIRRRNPFLEAAAASPDS